LRELNFGFRASFTLFAVVAMIPRNYSFQLSARCLPAIFRRLSGAIHLSVAVSRTDQADS
jgi:hypothetical protein